MTEAPGITPPPESWTQNSSFSLLSPRLQLAIDSTSLGALKTCPRLYYYTIICGWEPRQRSVHLQFGIWVHEGKEEYDRQIASGASHDNAVLAVFRRISRATWDRERNRPWTSDDPNKNRFTLLRTLVWYFEEYREDNIETVIFANGAPAVELSFSFDSGYRSAAGEPFLLCGHIDRLGRMNNRVFPCDVKTTKHTLGDSFFSQFSPNNQFSIYTLAAKIVYSLPTAGLIIDGAQIAVSFSRFERRESPRSEAQLNEWYEGLGLWLKTLQQYAAADSWPMNEASCGNYGGCPFRRICARSPSVRAEWLRADFVRRIWDPLKIRGDI